MTEETKTGTRYRINVSTSVKGIKTFECTVDKTNASMEDTLADSDRLVAELDKRYPAPVTEDK